MPLWREGTLPVGVERIKRNNNDNVPRRPRIYSLPPAYTNKPRKEASGYLRDSPPDLLRIHAHIYLLRSVSCTLHSQLLTAPLGACIGPLLRPIPTCIACARHRNPYHLHLLHFLDSCPPVSATAKSPRRAVYLYAGRYRRTAATHSTRPQSRMLYTVYQQRTGWTQAKRR